MSNLNPKEKAFTAQQQAAIDFNAGSILLEAGAGSGKTAVMTEKLFRLIESDQFELKQLLAITFTEAAASEMERRLYQQICAKSLEAAPTKQMEKWQRLKQIFYAEKQISTIHSLCLKVISQYPHLVPMDPQFKIISEGQGAEFLSEKWEDFLVEKISNFDPLLDELLAEFSLMELARVIAKIADQRRVPLPIKTGEDLQSEIIAHETRFIQKVRSFELLWAKCQNIFAQIYDPKQKSSAYVKAWYQHLTADPLWSASPSNYFKANATAADSLWEKCHQLLNNIPTANKRLSKEDDPQMLSVLQEMLTLIEVLGASSSKPSSFRQLLSLQQKVSLAFNQFLDQFQSLKKRQGLLDFNDLEFYAIYLLKNNPQIRRSFQQKYSYVMIDEFQDVNLSQFKIFRYLCRPNRRNFFCVGDPKQSIYGFRGSEVRLFSKLKKSNAQHAYNQNMLLSTNFRSHVEVMNFINVISADFFPKDNSKALFDAPYQALEAGRQVRPDDHDLQKTTLYKPAVQMHSYGTFTGLPQKILRAQEQAAEAQIILQMINVRLHLPVTIALLYRTLKSSLALQSLLTRKGIKFELSEGQGFYEQSEISEFLNILHIVQNPFRDILWSNFFRSHIFEISDSSFTQFFQFKKSKEQHLPTLYHLIKKLVWEEENLSADLLPLLNLFDQSQKKQLSALLAMIENRSSLGLSQLATELLKTLQIREKISRLDFPGTRTANLDTFFQLICDFEQGQGPDLADFLKDISYQIATKSSPGQSAPEQTDQKSLIKIMTIHASKGLEFDCVIIPELHKIPRYRRPLLFSDGPTGLLLRKKNELDPESPIFSEHYELANQNQQTREQAEAKRLLYVALTRAKSELLLIAYAQAPEPQEKQYSFFNFMSQLKPILTPPELEKAAQVSDNFLRNLVDESWQSVLGVNYWKFVPVQSSSESQYMVEFLAGYGNCTSLSTPAEQNPALLRDESAAISVQLPEISALSVNSVPDKNIIKLSVSEVMTAQFCHYKFLEMDLRKPLPNFEQSRMIGYSPAQFGTFFHAFLEHWDGQDENVPATYENACTRLNLESAHPLLQADFKHHFSNLIDLAEFESIFNNPIETDFTKVFRELPFIFKSKTCSIQGVMDRVHLGPDQAVHIIDWKTGKDSGNHLHYLPQVKLYAFAAQLIFPNVSLENIKFSLIFTAGKKGQVFSYRGDQLDLLSLSEELDLLIEKLKNPAQYPTYSDTCKKCEHRKYCPYQGQTKLNFSKGQFAL